VKSAARQPARSGHTLGLLSILVGIVLAVVVGLVWGKPLWMASGGPTRHIEELEKTARQKQRFAQQAAAAGNRTEAIRLNAQIPVIRQEIERMRGLQRQAEQTDLTVERNIFTIVRFCGDIFLRMLFAIVVPLVVTSMISGVTSIGDMRRTGKVGAWTLIYYLTTGAMAVVLGITLVEIIQPGVDTDDTFAYVNESLLARQEPSVIGTVLEVVSGRVGDAGSGMIPANILEAASQTNVLALILFSLVFGGALTTLGEKGRAAVEFFHAANEAVLKVVRLILFFAPLGIFGLIATKIIQSGGGHAFADELHRLGWFVATVLLGLMIHAIVLCLVLWVFGRRNPFRYLYAMGRALLTAMSTSSSSATLPVTIECVEEAGVSKRSAGFVLPLGATLNMDGTALYEATAAIFIAQSAGVPLAGAALVVVFLTATLAAIGAPGIPEAGLVTLLIVLAAVGLPATGIGTILAIDWFLDRQRTTLNVFGDAVGAAVIDHYLDKPRA